MRLIRITSESYLFRGYYEPEFVVTQDGETRAIKPKMRARLRTEIDLSIGKKDRLDTGWLIKNSTKYFPHYHSNCWGEPRPLATTLQEAWQKAFDSFGRLRTIDEEGLAERKPFGLPSFNEVRRATYPLKRRRPILIAGAGLVGSWLALFLAKENYAERLTIADPSDAKGSYRFYPFRLTKQAGSKAVYLAKKVRAKEAYVGKAEDIIGLLLPEIVFDCTDKKESQLAIWKKCSELSVKYLRVGVFGNQWIVSPSKRPGWEAIDTDALSCRDFTTTIRPAISASLIALRQFLRGEFEEVIGVEGR